MFCTVSECLTQDKNWEILETSKNKVDQLCTVSGCLCLMQDKNCEILEMSKNKVDQFCT